MSHTVVMSTVNKLLVALPLLLGGCGAADGDEPGNTGISGKADGFNGCQSGRNCIDLKSYEVLFTNPVCGTYAYDAPMSTVEGTGEVAAKPKNVYCTKAFDGEASRLRESSPQFRLLEWIDATGAGDEIFLAYLSFSDADVADALCEAEARGAEVTFVLDARSSKGDQVEACGGEVLIRGHQGSIQFQHNKILMINPNGAGPADDDKDFVRLSFGSGNMSSGTHLHHENWHFLEVARASFFVEAHRCVMQALIDPAHTNGKTAFKTFMNECRDEISFEPEEDLVPFFIPVRDDSKAVVDLMLELIDEAETVDVGAHRFSFTDMIEGFKARLADDSRDFHLRLIADDDLYWLDPLGSSKSHELGPNSFNEVVKLRELREADAGRGRFEDKYLETNDTLHLLHHNKYLLFTGMKDRSDALLVGSSNLTGTGFNDNLENFYYVDIPEVVDAFKAQYALHWDGEGPLPEGHDVAPLATSPQDMPQQLVSVAEPTDPTPTACGVSIVEVLYDAEGSDDGMEWVKLYNGCPTDASLDAMSLGWGGAAYTTGRLQLSGTLAAGACMLVGGPVTDASNGAPLLDDPIDFSPDLQNSGADADGIAVFGVPASEVTAQTLPLDAVIYGDANTNGLVDATGTAIDPHVGRAAAGQTLQRIDATQWTIGAPIASDCPSF